MATILITGGAGFIGYHLSNFLLTKEENTIVVAVDNLNNYYDVALKNARLGKLRSLNSKKYFFYHGDIENDKLLEIIFNKHGITHVINLAAQAGVRYSKLNPDVYISSNVQGFYKLIKTSANYKVKSFIYASSSSVYGANTALPFKETDRVGSPMSLYAATKLANESMASAFYYTHNLPVIGLRFFNVYGSWGRPDMAYYVWTEALLRGKELELRNSGEMWRDMTYVDDVIEAIIRLIKRDVISNKPEVFNVGNEKPVKIINVLDFLADRLEIKPLIINQPKGDEEPIKTWADTTSLRSAIQYSPNTNYKVGLSEFLDWYNMWQFNYTKKHDSEN